MTTKSIPWITIFSFLCVLCLQTEKCKANEGEEYTKIVSPFNISSHSSPTETKKHYTLPKIEDFYVPLRPVGRMFVSNKLIKITDPYWQYRRIALEESVKQCLSYDGNRITENCLYNLRVQETQKSNLALQENQFQINQAHQNLQQSINTLNSWRMLEAQQAPPPGPVNVRCTTIGRFTNCNAW